MTKRKCSNQCVNVDRRNLLFRTAPACAVACFGIGKLPDLSVLNLEPTEQDLHKWDVPSEISLTMRQRMAMQNRGMVELVKTLQGELDRDELLRLLNVNSANVGREVGERQAQNSPDREFQTFVQVFRPPNYETTLTHEIVEDTEKVFQLSVTECIWADTIQRSGLDGEVGHALVCNMDYYWPSAFNPAFKMERSKTLMQGHDECNHRYVNTA